MIWLYAYILIALLEIIAEAAGIQWMRFAFKPLLMPVLILWFLNTGGTLKNKTHLLLVIALIFSFSGDVNLMFVPLNPIFFMLGLASFLITHVLYIVIFKQTTIGNPAQDLSRKLPWLILCIFYCSALTAYLLPHLGELKIPVLIYTLTIFSMAFMGILRLNPAGNKAALTTLAGAVLFVISDSFIALNKFIFEGNLPFASIIIMTTYIIAQYLIVAGIKKTEN